MKTRPSHFKTHKGKGSDYDFWQSHIKEYNKKKRILAAPHRYRQCGNCKNLYCYFLRKNSVKPRPCNFCLCDEPLPITKKIRDILRKTANEKGVIL